MKILKRIRIALLACVMLTTSGAAVLMADKTVTARADGGTDVSHYFYNQLNSDAQRNFYKAMEAMNEDGTFIAGEDYDLVENKFVTQAQLQEYANGDNSLLDAMGAARDAFYTDYADIFYVDFGYLSLRVTQSGNEYRAYLGKGRADSYYVTGFDNAASVQQAIDKYNEAIETVVEDVKKAKPTDTQVKAFGNEIATTVAQLQAAHAWIAEHTIYKLEATCTPGNEGHVRTPYGVFVAKHDDGEQNKYLDNDQGEALCEGYSRAFKAVADRLGVPCVLVNGVYRHAEDKEELHMWCHVQLGDEWYAVDQTFDDINRRSAATGVLLKGLGDAYTEDYFLKGHSLMNTQHATSSYKSEVEYPFTYPQLAYSNLGAEVSTEHGAMIRVEQEPYSAGMFSTNIKVSVFVEDKDEYGNGLGTGKWCNYSQAAEKGLYLVVRYEGNYLPEQVLRANGGDLSGEKFDTDKTKYENVFLSWAYVNPIQGLYEGAIEDFVIENVDKDSEEQCVGYTIMMDTMKPNGFEFAVTTIAPRPYDRFETNLDRIAEMTSFLGDPTMFVARSGFIKTKYSDPDYQAPPYIVKATPSSWGKLSINKGSYNIEVEYDQYLKLAEGDNKIQMSVVGMRATGEFVKGTNAVILEKVVDLSTLKWDRGEGDNTHFVRGGRVSFKFTPSPEYAHDNIMYYFSLNLVGENSGKQVNDIEYAAGYESDACCYKANGFHWSVYAQPQLVESGDLSTEGWKTSDGTDLSNTKSRLALVVTSPSKKQEGQMNDLIGDELSKEEGFEEGDLLSSMTFNISLTICKGVSIETGQGVRIGIGFPEGFTYDDSMNGVMYKAYHFVRDAYNNVVEVEELEVTVTPLGLIILVKSFSPFAIVAIKSENTSVSTDKTVVVTSSNGGTAYADINGTKSNMFTVKEGDEPRNLSIKASAGNVIELIKINGEVVEVKNDKEMTLTFAYGEMDAQSVVEVSFVSESVKETEKSRGEGMVVQQLKAPVVSFSAYSSSNEEGKKTESVIGKKLEIKPTIEAYGSKIYQWYKDGVALKGQTGANLVIENATAEDAGTYTLKVTTVSGSSSASAMSEPIVVTMVEAPAPSPSSNSGLYIALGIVAGVVLLVIVPIIVVGVKKRRY